MSENFENRKNEVALRRFAAVSFIEQKVREGFGVVQASAWPRCVHGPTKMAAIRPHALWKITRMRGKGEVLPPSSPKAVGMKALFASYRPKSAISYQVEDRLREQ
jgi:hypothetical protein